MDNAPIVLIVGHPNPQDVAFAATFVDDFSEASSELSLNNYFVIYVPIHDSPQKHNLTEAMEFFDAVNAYQPDAKKVVVGQNLSLPTIKNLINSAKINHMVESFWDPQFDLISQSYLQNQLERASSEKLTEELNAKNYALRKLYSDLEKKISKRESYFKKAEKKIKESSRQTELLERVIVGIHHCGSIAEIESSVFSNLTEEFELSVFKIAFSSQSNFIAKLKTSEFDYLSFDFDLLQSEIGDLNRGQILFARKKTNPFSQREQELFEQITETVSLVIQRLMRLEQSMTLKQQWDSTFDSIAIPLCLIDGDGVVYRSNVSFSRQLSLAPGDVIGQKALHLFLQDKADPDMVWRKLKQEDFTSCSFASQGIERIVDFRLTPVPGLQYEDKPIYLLLLFDKTEEKFLESQLLESARLAELGTIGSSIAHELNNPLGGILSFVQLIKMDLLASNPIYQDICEMEAATYKCKDIVQGLLGFARQQINHPQEQHNLKDLIEKAAKIIEIQILSTGTTVRLNHHHKNILLTVAPNLVIQVVKDALQLLLDFQNQFLLPSTENTIVVHFTKKNDMATVELKYNCILSKDLEEPLKAFIESCSQLMNQSLSTRLLREDGGSKAIYTDQDGSLCVKICLPLPSKV